MGKDELKVITTKKEKVERNPIGTMDNILNTYLKDLEEARSPQIRIDALVLLKELVVIMNMYKEYEYKSTTLENEKTKSE
jgi:hypothetical protein